MKTAKVEVIAEFCQNHNGDTEILKSMLDAAAEAGASHCKVQTIFADDLSFRPEFEEGQMENGVVKTIKRPYQPEYERLKKLELDFEVQRKFVQFCQERNVEPLTTCFTRGSVSSIKEAGFKTIKVASYDCGSLPLIQDLTKNFDRLIVSTGATFDEEIQKTGEYLKSSDKNFSFLHCVTIYPTPLDQMHLRRLEYLKKYTASVGFSDHSLVSRDGVKATLAAIYLGASVVERHFTILPSDQTKDGPVSILPEHLREIVKFANLSADEQKLYLQEKVPEFESMLGAEERSLSDEELRNRAYYRGRFSTPIQNGRLYNWQEVSP